MGESVGVVLLGSIKKRISNGQQRDRQKESVSVKALHTVKSWYRGAALSAPVSSGTVMS